MSRRGITVTELLVTATCLTVLLTLIVLATGCAKMTDNRQRCRNNIQQLVLGLQNYHDTFLYLPYGARHRHPGMSKPSGYDEQSVTWGTSWLVATLPFCEQRPLFDKLVQADNLDPENDYLSPTLLKAAVTSTPIPYFVCPNTPLPRTQTAVSGAKLDVPSYAGIMGAKLGSDSRYVDGPYGGFATSNGMLTINECYTFAACTDGTANTIIVGEVSNWYYTDKGEKRNPTLSISDAGDGAKPEAGWLAGNNLTERTIYQQSPPKPKERGKFDTEPEEKAEPFKQLQIGPDRCLNLIALAHAVNSNNLNAASDNAPNWGTGGVGRCGFNNPLSSPHNGGALVGFLDGHVVLLSSQLAVDVLQKLAVRDDGGATPDL